ncbi:MAG: hypothetical protein MUE69_08280 [Myxococcota bacterium]|jgi:hypothetical protein|nr:hypothetical protein [Myxococcota bacterium]
MSSPRVLVVTWYSPAGPVFERVLGGAQVTLARPDRAMLRRVSADVVLVDVARDAPEALREQVKAWTGELVRSGTSALVLCDPNARVWPKEETAAAEMHGPCGSPQTMQLEKPVRGPELRGMLGWMVGAMVKRDPELEGRAEELLLCGLHMAQQFGLSKREMELLVGALELRGRDEIAERMGVKRSQVDALARGVAERSSTSLESVVRQAWLEWANAVADDEGSGSLDARTRKGSGEVVQVDRPTTD